MIKYETTPGAKKPAAKQNEADTKVKSLETLVNDHTKEIQTLKREIRKLKNELRQAVNAFNVKKNG